MDTEIKFIDYGAKKFPEKKHPEDAGFDVYAPSLHICRPHHCEIINLGFGISLPRGYMATIIPRGSGGIRGIIPVANPIDAGYTGECHAMIWNQFENVTIIEEGERFCQLVIQPIVDIPLKTLSVIKPEEAPVSERGDGHFGSTNDT